MPAERPFMDEPNFIIPMPKASRDLVPSADEEREDLTYAEKQKIQREARAKQTREWLHTKFNISLEEIEQAIAKKRLQHAKKNGDNLFPFDVQAYLVNRFKISHQEASNVVQASLVLDSIAGQEFQRINDNRLRQQFDSVETDLPRIELDAHDLLDQIKEKINERFYDSILGDDSSARLHALLISRTMQELYGNDKKLETLFVKGGALLKTEPIHQDNVKKYFERQKEKLGKHVLIVTEEFLGGDSIVLLIKFLKELGIHADVAAFRTTDQHEFQSHGEMVDSFPNILSLGSALYVGHKGYVSPVDKDLLGVTDKRIAYENGTAVMSRDKTMRPAVVAARQKIKQIAHKLALDFKS